MSPLLISDTLQVQSRGVEPRNREFLLDSAFFTSFSSAAFCASSWRDREVAFPTSIRPFFWKVLLSSIFFVRHVWPLRRLPQPFVVSLNALAYLCIGSRRKAGRPSLLRQETLKESAATESSKRRKRKSLRGHDNDQLPALQTRMRRARYSLGLLAAVAAFAIWRLRPRIKKNKSSPGSRIAHAPVRF